MRVSDRRAKGACLNAMFSSELARPKTHKLLSLEGMVHLKDTYYARSLVLIG